MLTYAGLCLQSRRTPILRRFNALISGYLERLASIGALASTLAQRPEVERVFFELALIQKAGVRESLRELIYRALGMGHELSNGQGAPRFTCFTSAYVQILTQEAQVWCTR